MIKAIEKDDVHTDSSDPLCLRALLLIIYDASTFEGQLQDVYRGEFEVFISDLSVITDAVSD